MGGEPHLQSLIHCLHSKLPSRILSFFRDSDLLRGLIENMRIISRYIALELTKVIVLCLGGFIAIYLIIDFFERIDNFFEAHLPLSLASEYFLLKCPLILQQGIPIAVLMGTLITLGLMARSNELLVLKGNGISPVLVNAPIVIIALLFTLVNFGLAEYFVPLTSARANYIWNVRVEHLPRPGSFSQEKIWYKSGRVLYNIRVLHPKRQMLEGITLYIFDHSFRLTNRLDARKAQWDGESWIFFDGIFLERTADGGFSMERFQRRHLHLKERPEDFQHLDKDPAEMTLAELGRYVALIESEGYDSTRYRVEFHAKIAFPFTSLIMALLGIGVALYQGKRGGIAMGIAASVAAAFIYFLISQLVLSLGNTGNLQPLLAAWTPNLFFGLASLFLFAHAMH
jgi:lipopolysaccharide export system permease protein